MRPVPTSCLEPWTGQEFRGPVPRVAEAFDEILVDAADWRHRCLRWGTAEASPVVVFGHWKRFQCASETPSASGSCSRKDGPEASLPAAMGASEGSPMAPSSLDDGPASALADRACQKQLPCRDPNGMTPPTLLLDLQLPTHSRTRP